MRVEVASRKDVLNSFLKMKKKRIAFRSLWFLLILQLRRSCASALQFSGDDSKSKAHRSPGKAPSHHLPPCSVMRTAGASLMFWEKNRRRKKGRIRPGEGESNPLALALVLLTWETRTAVVSSRQSCRGIREEMRVVVESGEISLGAAAFSLFKDKDYIILEKLF